MIRETLTLEADGAVLAGTLTLPESEAPAPLVVGVHGAEGGTRDFHLFRHLESTLPPAGLATLLFDRRGEGESAGDSKGVSYELLAADVQAWLRCCAADRRIGTYSNGMRQRARLSAALVHDPAVLLLDEPFNGMDPLQRLELMATARHGAARLGARVPDR